MAKISQKIAEKTSQKMAEERYQGEIDVLLKEASEITRKWLLTLVPTEVIETFKTSADWIKTTSYYSFPGQYNRYPRLSLYFESLPNIENCRKTGLEDVKNEVFALLDKADKLREEKEILRRRIEQTMLDLGSYKRLQVEFVECYNAIPSELYQKETGTRVPSIPIESIRKELFPTSKFKDTSKLPTGVIGNA